VFAALSCAMAALLALCEPWAVERWRTGWFTTSVTRAGLCEGLRVQ